MQLRRLLRKPRLAIIGCAGHAVVALDVAMNSEMFDFVGWIDSYAEVGSEVEGFPVLGSPAQIENLIAEHKIHRIFVGISNNFIRQQMTLQIKALAPTLSIATLVHPFSSISRSVTVGEGSLIMPGSIVNSRSTIGKGTIVNTKVSIDHDCRIGNFSSLLPGVVTGGDVSIGEGTCVCIGSVIGHQTTIGEHSVIGAASLVLRDLPSFSLAWGRPAVTVRNRAIDEKHF